MATSTKTYGRLRDDTILTDASAREIVNDAFAKLESGKGKVIKQPEKQIRFKISVHKLPSELQEAALFK